nr:MAG TPA: tail assembly chaperone protein [Caudoviricetes sp.]
MKVTIKEQEITLKYSLRSLFLYERKTGESFSPRNIEQFCLYFYCVVCSSNKDLDLTFDEFIDEVIDPQPELMSEFAEWLNHVTMKNSFLSNAAQSQEKESKGKGNKKK